MDAKEMERLMGFGSGELEATADAYESGDWPEGRTVRLGRPTVAGEPTQVVSGRVAQSVAEAFDAKAKSHGQTRAERIRELVNADVLSA